MRTTILIIVGGVGVMGAIVGGIAYENYDTTVTYVSMAVNDVKYMRAPAGTTLTELAPDYKGGQGVGTPTVPAASGDWPSYNKTLTSERFSQLSQINTSNANKLQVLCTYDTGDYTGFNSGLIEIDGSLIFTTQLDIFSIDPATCHLNWRYPRRLQACDASGCQPRRGLHGRQVVPWVW